MSINEMTVRGFHMASKYELRIRSETQNDTSTSIFKKNRFLAL